MEAREKNRIRFVFGSGWICRMDTMIAAPYRNKISKQIDSNAVLIKMHFLVLLSNIGRHNTDGFINNIPKATICVYTPHDRETTNNNNKSKHTHTSINSISNVEWVEQQHEKKKKSVHLTNDIMNSCFDYYISRPTIRMWDKDMGFARLSFSNSQFHRWHKRGVCVCETERVWIQRERKRERQGGRLKIRTNCDLFLDL